MNTWGGRIVALVAAMLIFLGLCFFGSAILLSSRTGELLLRGGVPATVAPTRTNGGQVVPVPVATPVPQPPAVQPQGCEKFHEYPLVPGMLEVATHSNTVDATYWLRVQAHLGSAPEYEYILHGGRYALTNTNLGGHVWEFRGCTLADMQKDVEGSVARRRAQNVNNGGYADWQASGLFRKVSP